MRSDPGPSLEPVPDAPRDDPRDDSTGVPLYATAEEVAYAAELAALDRAEDAALRAEWAAAGFDVPGLDVAGFDVPVDDAAWDEALAELADDDALIGALRGPAHAADLMLVDSIDPASLTSQHARLDYLRACDRIAAKVAAHRGDVVVALVGERSSQAYLPEVHAEHELALAERTSKYAAGKLIERSRALAASFPGFAAALRAGEVSELHCTVLVERTRVVVDEAVLAQIERRVLPKARRMTAGQLATEVAKAIALLDRDAAANPGNVVASARDRSMSLPAAYFDVRSASASSCSAWTSGRYA